MNKIFAGPAKGSFLYRIWPIFFLAMFAFSFGRPFLPSFQNFRMTDFMKTHNGGELLLPASCNPARGNEGIDYVVGEGYSTNKDLRIDTACWYSAEAFNRLYPEFIPPDAQDIRTAQYNRMGFKLQAMDPWASLMGAVLPLVVIFVMVVPTFLMHARKTKPNDQSPD